MQVGKSLQWHQCIAAIAVRFHIPGAAGSRAHTEPEPLPEMVADVRHCLFTLPWKVNSRPSCLYCLLACLPSLLPPHTVLLARCSPSRHFLVQRLRKGHRHHFRARQKGFMVHIDPHSHELIRSSLSRCTRAIVRRSPSPTHFSRQPSWFPTRARRRLRRKRPMRSRRFAMKIQSRAAIHCKRRAPTIRRERQFRDQSQKRAKRPVRNVWRVDEVHISIARRVSRSTSSAIPESHLPCRTVELPTPEASAQKCREAPWMRLPHCRPWLHPQVVVRRGAFRHLGRDDHRVFLATCRTNPVRVSRSA
jgi:hypothetical protein